MIKFIGYLVISDNYSCIRVKFFFQRRLGIYLVNTYIPGMLAVMMSWVSFWIDATSVPARITIGMLTILTVTTQATYTLSALPRGRSPLRLHTHCLLCLEVIYYCVHVCMVSIPSMLRIYYCDISHKFKRKGPYLLFQCPTLRP